MNRKLTKEEEKICRTGINNRKKTIAELKKEVSYFEEFNTFNDKWAKYQEDKAIKAKERKQAIMKSTLKQLKENLETEQNSMKTEQNQLKFGVEIKKAPVGVN